MVDVGRECLERRRHILFKLLSTPRQLSRSPAGGGESMMVQDKQEIELFFVGMSTDDMNIRDPLFGQTQERRR